ncbi:MAG: molybdopterin-dependent oxidoreductase [Bacteroidota bacterium]|nr:molybdopterin-dependent oxidoreductase [Bacteroidota bacterium]
MRVTGADGKQTFRKASWDEAMDVVAEKLQKIKAEHGLNVRLFSPTVPAVITLKIRSS